MPGEWTATAHIGLERDTRAVGRAIAVVADAQDGVIRHDQLIALGLSARAIQTRLQSGRLHVLFRGVYAVGHSQLSQRGWWRAATYAVSDGVICHGSAIAFSGLREPLPGPIHVSTPARARRRRFLVPHCRRLPEDERTVRDGVPVVTVARALLDIAGSEGRGTVDRALREAHFQWRRNPAAALGNPAAVLARLVDRYPGARGTAVARAALEDRAFLSRTRSEFEAVFLEFLPAHGIERPRTNEPLRVGGERFEVDCLWPCERLIVELDGRRAHNDPERFELDRRRDAILESIGYCVYRLTWRRLQREPKRVADELRALLAGRGP